MVARSTKWGLAVGACGIVLICLGAILGWAAFPAIVDSTIADTVAIKKGSDAYDRWVEIPLPMQFKIRIFDVQNPEEVTKGETPKFIERGPYIYTENRYKENVEYYEDEDRAYYNQRAVFHFDAENSNGSESDYVTVPDIPMLSFAQVTESIPLLASTITTFGKTAPIMWPGHKGIFMNVTVGEYLFGGVPMFCNQTPNFANIGTLLMCASYKLVAPPTVTIGTDGINPFSFFKYKNNTYDGKYEVRLGIDDVEQIGEVLSWNDLKHTDKWGGETCNKIHGTDSTVFRPKLDDVDQLTIYNTDICRAVTLTYQKETDFKGIAGRRYVADHNVFASAENNNDNYCYCPQTVSNLTQRGGCLRDGALDLSSCQGAPVVLSFAHFLHADKLYQSYYPDLKANEEEHQIFLDLEPNTGTPLRASSRIQMNVHLKPIAEVDFMSKFNNQLLPVLWVEEGVELSDELIDMLHTELLDVLDALNIVRWVLVAVGIALTVGAGGYLLYKKYRS